MKRKGLQGALPAPDTQAVMVWGADGRVTLAVVRNQYESKRDGPALRDALYAGNKALQEFDRNLGAYQRKDRPN